MGTLLCGFLLPGRHLSSISNIGSLFPYRTAEKNRQSTLKIGPRVCCRLVDKKLSMSLVPRGKIIFLSWHIKPGLIKQFVKALGKEFNYFRCFCNAFSEQKDEILTVKKFAKWFVKKWWKCEKTWTVVVKLWTISLETKIWRIKRRLLVRFFPALNLLDVRIIFSRLKYLPQNPGRLSD